MNRQRVTEARLDELVRYVEVANFQRDGANLVLDLRDARIEIVNLRALIDERHQKMESLERKLDFITLILLEADETECA